MCHWWSGHRVQHGLCAIQGMLIVYRVLSCSCSQEIMKILFVDNCSKETWLADILIRCSNHLALRRIRASNWKVSKLNFLWTVVYEENFHHFITPIVKCHNITMYILLIINRKGLSTCCNIFLTGEALQWVMCPFQHGPPSAGLQGRHLLLYSTMPLQPAAVCNSTQIHHRDYWERHQRSPRYCA